VASAGSNQILTDRVDLASDRAVFRQIADHLRDAVSFGRLREGDQLPSETQLMGHYGVTRMTIRQALGILKAEGLVVAEHGRGVFVRRRPPVRRLGSDRFARRHRERGKAAFLADAETAGGEPGVDEIEVTEEQPSPTVAGRLGLRRRERVVARRRRYLIDGHPVELATSFVPASIARGTPISQPNSGPGGIYARLEELGYRLDHFDEEIRSRMPRPDEAARLTLANGVPVFELVRTAYDNSGRAVEVCETIMSADSYVLEYRLQAE
jgi:GntR family transcriptional regulator